MSQGEELVTHAYLMTGVKLRRARDRRTKTTSSQGKGRARVQAKQGGNRDGVY